MYEIRPHALDDPVAPALLAALEACASVELVRFASGMAWATETEALGLCLAQRMAG